MGYPIRPGDVHRYDHPLTGGDDCTSLSASPSLLADLWGGDLDLPGGPLPVSGAVDPEHQILLTDARKGADAHALLERGMSVLAMAISGVDARRVERGRLATTLAHLAVARRQGQARRPDAARELQESRH